MKIGLNFNNISKPEYKILKDIFIITTTFVSMFIETIFHHSLFNQRTEENTITFCWWHWRCYPGQRMTRFCPSKERVAASWRLWNVENSRHLCCWMAHQKPDKKIIITRRFKNRLLSIINLPGSQFHRLAGTLDQWCLQ